MTDSAHPIALRALERFDQMFPDSEERGPSEAPHRSDVADTAHIESSDTLAPAARSCKVSELGPWTLGKTHNVDCLEGMRGLPNDCLDLVVTSPPYWGQRGNGGLGLEPDPRDYISNLVTILNEAMRCLKPTGLLWLNVGDAYNTPINWREEDYVHSSLGPEGKGLDKTNSAYTKVRGRRRACIEKDVPFLQYGNLLAIPYRIVIAMSDLGWLFRGEVIWAKSRALPEGICRRPHRKHEGIYLFAKSEKHPFRVKPPVGSVWDLVQTPNKLPHCSTFPLDLPLQAINASALQDEAVVCDPFMGSGTTARAAAMLGFTYLGFELDPAMCALANGSDDMQPAFEFTRV